MTIWQIIALVATVAGTVWAFRTIPRMPASDDHTLRTLAFIVNTSRLAAIWAIFAMGWLLCALRPDPAATYLTLAALFATTYSVFGWLADHVETSIKRS